MRLAVLSVLCLFCIVLSGASRRPSVALLCGAAWLSRRPELHERLVCQGRDGDA